MSRALNSQAEPIPVEATESAVSGIFSRVRVVLVETSHPGNVGSVARAMKTMGFGGQPGSLVLVSPREPGVLAHPDAVAMASGADDVLAGARIVDDVESALAGTAFTVAMTARQREFGPPRLLPRAAAARGHDVLAADGGAIIAFVFGNERYGLPNDAVLRCSAVTHIPANPAYASLNLAQAVQLITYEMRLALLEGQPGQSGPGEASDGTPNIGYAGEPATAEQVESMFDHLHAGLVAIGFLDPDNPRKLMPRLRRMFARAGLEREEVNILRGIARRMLMARDGQDTPADGNKES
ncbi:MULTISPECIES: RNA methyltransferase [unclassified Cupriavidus]|uniref:RNA methyltransferase n=1 Tax=unclassified Cupriavidus TaxID=2640874 RepID=UPI001C007402|nr:MULTISPECIES: RNA methyltransferase [unclassified Cupriavidus]MCA3184763.1 RNA methyltransferase [Cupriavidus sp.]MCA3191169.1 RNA methyltransferase [Cupriavidus sp.]MCA3200233.1 RNA methyltransferase [Cupriavidus sp.]MCA3205434.1 RNA methyltransferase [Cupriavidus sp.]MCA3208267.1 RNA methyltransferase [Cupriavidus sp.]